MNPSCRSSPLRKLLSLATLLAMLGVCPSALRAQSISSGSLRGTVNDTSGRAVRDARVELRDVRAGLRRSQRTDRTGGFAFEFLPPGEYSLLAEQLGYRPVETHGIVVQPGGDASLLVALEPAEPPVMERGQAQFEPGVLSHDDAGTGWQLGTFQLRRLPDDARELGSTARFTTVADDDLAVEGLPGRFTTISLDGVPFAFVHHPVPGWLTETTLAFPLSSVSAATVDPGGLDVEWSGFAGGRLNAVGRRGGSRFEARAFGDWSGTDLTRSKFYSPQDLNGQSFRGGLLASGPVIRDTAHFVVGVEARQLKVPFPPAWEPTALDEALVGVAADTFGVDLGPYRGARLASWRSGAAFGRFDWQASDANRLSVTANGGLVDATDPPVGGAGRVAAPTATLKGTDVAVGATLASSLSPLVALELRASFATSKRTYASDGTVFTVVPAGPLAFGTDPALPGVFRRTRFQATETLHIQAGRHRLKTGLGGGVDVADNTYDYERAGTFVVGGVDQLGASTGGFHQRVGPLLGASSALGLGGYLQDRWRAMPGLDLLLGFRVDWWHVRGGDVTANDAWFARTRIHNDSLDRNSILVSPRAGLLWDVGDGHRWIVRIDGGVYQGSPVDDALIEAVTAAERISARRGVGAINRWPMPPDSATAPLTGPVLSLLFPSTRPPRTGRAQLGVSGALGGGVGLHLALSYRHTDFLRRRNDLNLLPAPVAVDQYARPVYGRLSQSGAALLVEPESNRRFDEFDQVVTLNQDGYSDYVGATIRLEKQVGRAVLFSAGYTYSRTEDNWLGARGSPDMQMSPFPDSLDGVDWADGRSDFDVPHRVVLGMELNFGVARLAGSYTYRTGYPFTPGFRDGVDANGDGSWRNDPAYVDEGVTGVGDLFGAWDCLRRNVGRFAERNACQGPAVRRLDARLVLGPVRLGAPVEIVLDALNLLDAEYADVDRALYLVDPAGALVSDPAAGTISVPLVANPDFGRPIRRYGSGRQLRLGLRVNYE